MSEAAPELIVTRGVWKASRREAFAAQPLPRQMALKEKQVSIRPEQGDAVTGRVAKRRCEVAAPPKTGYTLVLVLEPPLGPVERWIAKRDQSIRMALGNLPALAVLVALLVVHYSFLSDPEAFIGRLAHNLDTAAALSTLALFMLWGLRQSQDHISQFLITLGLALYVYLVLRAAFPEWLDPETVGGDYAALGAKVIANLPNVGGVLLAYLPITAAAATVVFPKGIDGIIEAFGKVFGDKTKDDDA
jgi:hypothetical protein